MAAGNDQHDEDEEESHEVKIAKIGGRWPVLSQKLDSLYSYLLSLKYLVKPYTLSMNDKRSASAIGNRGSLSMHLCKRRFTLPEETIFGNTTTSSLKRDG